MLKQADARKESCEKDKVDVLRLSFPAILLLSLFSIYSSALFVLCFFFVLQLKMSQKSTEQLCVNDVVEIDGLKGTINLGEEQWNELLKVNNRAKNFRKSGRPHYEKLVRIFRDTTATGVNACPSTRLISDFKDDNENDVASNTIVGVEENDKGKSKKRVRRNRDEFGSFFSSFLDIYAENAKRKNDILEKRSFDCTSSEVDENQTSSKKDDSMKS
ncbi:L10-interacting MYB domain-containing protein-like [Cucumis melo var. makuwa]|uniref:L10-interacting MYB domain-containing protein-like n=1 Tax=Cucumis melo var. makuwa TaxID=1194695 RepID=A0A5D3CU77_CUCMM|nr:L10-interacting MYB domain-containing protein-like [Cucumis melo var. makuwa]TYK14554.1 L10-interacting MYB domain-containing protein-like [Cucumis melo var. makuwa]